MYNKIIRFIILFLLILTVNANAAGFTLSNKQISVNESNTSNFSIVLDTAPTSDVVFSIISSNTNEATVQETVTFTPSNWNTLKSIDIISVDDYDIRSGDNTAITF